MVYSAVVGYGFWRGTTTFGHSARPALTEGATPLVNAYVMRSQKIEVGVTF